MYGQDEFADYMPGRVGPETPLDDQDVPPSDVPKELHVVLVQTVQDPLVVHMLCPLCQADDDRVKEEVAACGPTLVAPTCTKDWLTGRTLRGDKRLGLASCQCFITDPYPPGKFKSKKDANRRFFMWHTIAKELGVAGPGVRGRHSPCVTRMVESLYGNSVTGFSA